MMGSGMAAGRGAVASCAALHHQMHHFSAQQQARAHPTRNRTGPLREAQTLTHLTLHPHPKQAAQAGGGASAAERLMQQYKSPGGAANYDSDEDSLAA